MLVQLTVQNLVLLEKVTLEPGPGFNVLTGETGAGKSMLVDALSLVLGGRASPEAVRAGAREAEVEALFEITPGSRVAAKLEAADIPCAGELVVRRVVMAEGRSRAYLNGRLGTVAQLAELAPDLCDVASQHESVSLTDPATHLGYLDAFGKLAAERDELATLVEGALEVSRALDAARAAEQGRAEREDFLAFQLKEIDELAPREGEDVELENERNRLRHGSKLREATSRAAFCIDEGEDAIADRLGRLSAELHAACALDGTLEAFVRAIDGARAELVEAARGLGSYAESVESNPERLAEVEERAFRLKKLLRKHGGTVAEVMRQRATLAAELEALSGAQDRIAALEAERARLLPRLVAAAGRLSEKRRAAAEKLADAIGRELGQLGMGRARVVVEVERNAASSGDALVVEGARLTRAGLDRVEFLIAPNRGEEPRPLRKIASGGELSRALLALKRVLAEKGPAGLYVFDEVDAGVGGAIAEVIGRSIAEVARHRQVLCITHLPQIAAQADVHFVVGKSEQRGRTTTTLRRLKEGERVDEIARMIGGVRVGDAARRAASEMLRR
jgi:DNA repair protein RecN (Recombination protein N)